MNFLNAPLVDGDLAEHDPVGEKHLDLFEHTAKALCQHEMDFGKAPERMFFNVIGLRDSARRSRPLRDGGWVLSPGQRYKLDIYHFYPEEGPMAHRPTYWLGCKASGDGLTVLGSGLLRADSEYDAKTVDAQTKGGVQSSQNVLIIYRTFEPKNDNAMTAELTFNVEVEPDRLRNVLQSVVIGVFVAIPGLIAIYPDVPSWKGALILAGGLVAGFASTFKFSRSI